MEGQVDLENLVQKANSGNREALDFIVLEIKDMVYNLSLKMLLFSEDAKDATQEILIKVITHLSTFKGESKFTTWVYKIAVNYLLRLKNSQSKQYAMPFSDYENLIDVGHSDVVLYTENEGMLSLLEEEVKVSCTHGLLLCLDEASRIVYILGEILNLNSIEGSEILEISADNFRKKLSRSRSKIRNFLTSRCGLVNSSNACRCKKKIDFLIKKEMINPEELQFAKQSKRSIDLISKIDTLDRSVAVYRSVPKFKVPGIILTEIRQTIQTINN